MLQLNVLLNQLLLNGANQTQIDDAMELIKSAFLTPSKNLGMTKKINTKKNNRYLNKNKIHRPGFDSECINKRTNFLKIKKLIKEK